jgi:hypothetical protein
MWKGVLVGFILLLVVGAILTRGHIEVLSPETRTMDIKISDIIPNPAISNIISSIIETQSAAEADLITHTYLWGDEGLFSKEYDVKIYIAGHLIPPTLGITQKEMNDVLESLDNTYKGILDLPNQIPK